MGSQTLGIGVASATIAFNDGMQQTKEVFKRQHMNPGRFTSQTLAELDKKKLIVQNNRIYQRQSNTERRRKMGYEYKFINQEGVVYEAGMGDDFIKHYSE